MIQLVSILLLAAACSAHPTSLLTHGALVAGPAIKGHAYSTQINHGTAYVHGPVHAPLAAHHYAPAAVAYSSKVSHVAPAHVLHAAAPIAHHAAVLHHAAPLAHHAAVLHHAAPLAHHTATLHHAAPLAHHAAVVAPLAHHGAVVAAHHAPAVYSHVAPAPILHAAPAHHVALNYKGSALVH